MFLYAAVSLGMLVVGLGLLDDRFGLDAPTQPLDAPVAPSAESELTPFLLEDLGLSPDEIAQLEAAQSSQPAAEPAATSDAQQQTLAALGELVAEGKVQPVLWQTMGFNGVAEAHQVLMMNGLRNRVTLRTDGGMKTGRDIVIVGGTMGSLLPIFNTASEVGV